MTTMMFGGLVMCPGLAGSTSHSLVMDQYVGWARTSKRLTIPHNNHYPHSHHPNHRTPSHTRLHGTEALLASVHVSL